MTVRPPRPCANPMCPNLVTDRNPRCPPCAREFRKPQDEKVKRAHPERTRYYRGTAWKKLRLWKLRLDPICERCRIRGERVKATDVHHKDGNWRNAHPTNLEALCAACHRAEGGRQSAEKRRAAG